MEDSWSWVKKMPKGKRVSVCPSTVWEEGAYWGEQRQNQPPPKIPSQDQSPFNKVPKGHSPSRAQPWLSFTYFNQYLVSCHNSAFTVTLASFLEELLFPLAAELKTLNMMGRSLIWATENEPLPGKSAHLGVGHQCTSKLQLLNYRRFWKAHWTLGKCGFNHSTGMWSARTWMWSFLESGGLQGIIKVRSKVIKNIPIE